MVIANSWRPAVLKLAALFELQVSFQACGNALAIVGDPFRQVRGLPFAFPFVCFPTPSGGVGSVMANSRQDRSQEADPSLAPILSCPPSNDYISRLPPLASEHIIAAGHVTAAAGCTFSAVAASTAKGSPLPLYGAALFVMVLSLRLILLSRSYGSKTPYTLKGADMSLLAAILFVSNSLASVGTLCCPEKALVFVAFSALDVTANWLEMVANATTPTLPRHAALKSTVLGAGDGYVAATVAGLQAIAAPLWPAFLLKAGINCLSAGAAIQTILARDAARRSTSNAHRKDD